jgi:O-acetylserine/cysteine efflux transporter
MKPLDLLMAVLMASLWGMGFVLAKFGLGQFPPMLLMGLRFTLAALVLVWFAPMPRREMPRIVLVALVAGAISYSLTFYAFKEIDASLGSILIQLESPLAVLLALVFLKERITWLRAAGIAIAFVGVVLIAGQPKFIGNLTPIFLLIGGGITWASGQVMAKKVSHIGGFRMTAWFAVLVAPQFFLGSLLLEHDHLAVLRAADWRGWAIVLYLGLGMTALGYTLWYRLISRYRVNQVSPFLLLIPVVAVIGSMIFLGERPTLQTLIGGAVVLVGVALSTWGPERAPRAVAPVTDAPGTV